MLFKERLVQLRLTKGWNQDEAAKQLGIAKRTLQYYEAGEKYPRVPGVYKRIGEVFDIDSDFLLSEEDYQIIFAIEKGGAKVRRDVQALVTEVGGLFAGGELSDDDKDKVLQTITALYWRAKENNKKYTPKKHRQDNE